MKIAFVNNQLQLGGAETVLHQLRSGMEQRGHSTQVHVAEGKTYPSGVEPLYPAWLSRLTHTRLHVPVERLFPRAQWTDHSFRALAFGDADLIHVHNFHGTYATVASLAYLARHKPLVWTFHAFWGVTGGCDHPGSCLRYQQSCGECPQLGIWPLGRMDSTRAQLEEKLRSLALEPLHVIAPSRFLARQVAASQVGRCWHVHQIANGVEPCRYRTNGKRDAASLRQLGLPGADVPTLLVVNRNFKDKRKGFPAIREALWTVTADHRVQVILAGENSDWAVAQLSGIACASLGYVTSRETMANLYACADIFLFASEAENFPCVILEAMAAACCVVATPVGGVPEQITAGQHGYLAEANTGSALANVLREALVNPATSARLGLNARCRVEAEFSEAEMIARHLNVYAEVFEAHQARLPSTNRLPKAAHRATPFDSQESSTPVYQIAFDENRV